MLFQIYIMKKIKKGKLTFNQNLIINQKKYYHELLEGSHCHWEPNMSENLINEINNEWRENNVFNWRWAKSIKNKQANENEITHFIFCENEIKYVRESFGKKMDLEDEFNWIERDDFYSIRFYKDKNGKAKKTVMNIGTTHQELWNVDFFIKKEKYTTKNILGFDCYKVKMVELRYIDKQLSIKNYEMFVTPEIQLPTHAVLFLNAFAIEECPLEVKCKPEGVNEFFEIRSAIKFEEYDTSSELILPKEYEEIKNDMNLEKPYNYQLNSKAN